jgi:hypothetical protein
MGGKAGGPFSASGGDVAEINGYRIHTFTSSGDFVIQSGKAILELLVVSGGGGGADYGGGGGGGLVEQISVEATLPGTYPVVVGAGGAAGAIGEASSAIGLSTTPGRDGAEVTARKGGDSGQPPTPALTGGNGLVFSVGGWNGGYYIAGGGGAGVGSAGSNASSQYAGEDSYRTYGGTGGTGIQSFYRLGNTGVYYAGGGGGGSGGRNPNQGGAGAGGTAASSDGASNSGAGGGGNSRAGGSGIVIIRYQL